MGMGKFLVLYVPCPILILVIICARSASNINGNKKGKKVLLSSKSTSSHPVSALHRQTRVSAKALAER